MMTVVFFSLKKQIIHFNKKHDETLHAQGQIEKSKRRFHHDRLMIEQRRLHGR